MKDMRNKNHLFHFSNRYVRSKFVQCFIVAGMATVFGVITAISLRQPILALTALLVVAFFVYEALEIIVNDRAGRYVTVPAIMKEKTAVRVFAGFPSKSVGKKSFTYRFARLNEQREVIDESGQSDIYLTISEKQSYIYGLSFEGRVHILLFCKTEAQPYDTSTLRGIYYD